MLNTALSLINQAIPEQSEDSINVKLPPYNNLSDVSRFFEELNKSLEQAICHPGIDGNVEIKSFESGSLWMTFAVGAAALKIVLDLLKQAFEARKIYYEGSILKENLRSLSLKNDTLQEFESAFEEKYNNDVESKARQIIANNNIADNQPEYIERLKLSIKTIVGLINEGAEFHPSLNAPDEVKEQFPNVEQYELKNNTILELTEGEVDSQETPGE